ncbi:MAG: hypothetical protein GQ574_08450 [Crocinitomix sp.]|nr:hypothetical protein [Crocinitomix sp.]
MSYHSITRQLQEFVYNLTFSEDFCRSRTDDPLVIDYTIKSTCNGLRLDKFEMKLNSLLKGVSQSAKQIPKNEIIDVLISLEILKNEIFDGVKYIRPENNTKPKRPEEEEIIKSEMLSIGNVYHDLNPTAEFHLKITQCFGTLKEQLKSLIIGQENEMPSKLEWNVGPSLLGALMEELEIKQWVSPPLYNGSTSSEAYGKLAASLFSYHGDSERSLINAIRESKLDEFKRHKISLPFTKELN